MAQPTDGDSDRLSYESINCPQRERLLAYFTLQSIFGDRRFDRFIPPRPDL